MWLLVLSDGVALFAVNKKLSQFNANKKSIRIFSIVKVKACLTFVKLL